MKIDFAKLQHQYQLYKDDIDKKILDLIQIDDKTSYKEIHKKLGKAASSIHSRVRKMKEDGIIKSFSAIVDPGKVGYETTAIIGLSIDPLKIGEIAEKISTYPETMLVAVTTGDHDIAVTIISENEKTLWNFINEKIKPVIGVNGRMDVSSLLRVNKNTHVLDM